MKLTIDTHKKYIPMTLVDARGICGFHAYFSATNRLDSDCEYIIIVRMNNTRAEIHGVFPKGLNDAQKLTCMYKRIQHLAIGMSDAAMAIGKTVQKYGGKFFTRRLCVTHLGEIRYSRRGFETLRKKFDLPLDK